MGNKKLVDRIAERFDGNREVAQHALDSVVEGITRSLAAGEKVVIKRFGVFDRHETDGKKSQRSVVPVFRPKGELKDVVAGVKKVRSRVLGSLSLVPSQAAAVAETAARAASSAARAAAEVVRGDDETARTDQRNDGRAGETPAPPASPDTVAEAGIGRTTTAATRPARKAPATKTAAKKTPAKKAAAKKTAAKKAAAKKAPAKKTATKKTAPGKPATEPDAAPIPPTPSDTEGTDAPGA